MAVHTVQQGECLSSLAARFGFAGWQQLYEHAANAKLRKQRPNPNVLAPGDQVVVPDHEPTKLVPIVTTRMHSFQLKLPTVKLRIVIADRSGKPYDVKRFVVDVGERAIEKTAPPGGLVEVEVPAIAATARLRVWIGDGGNDEDADDDAPPTIDRNLSIGHIDPIESISGVRGRLANLGYKCAVSDEAADDRMLAAARSFRADHDLPEIDPPVEDAEPSDDGDGSTPYADRLIDDDFRNKLLAIYESAAGSSGSS